MCVLESGKLWSYRQERVQHHDAAVRMSKEEGKRSEVLKAAGERYHGKIKILNEMTEAGILRRVNQYKFHT